MPDSLTERRTYELHKEFKDLYGDKAWMKTWNFEEDYKQKHPAPPDKNYTQYWNSVIGNVFQWWGLFNLRDALYPLDLGLRIEKGSSKADVDSDVIISYNGKNLVIDSHKNSLRDRAGQPANDKKKMLNEPLILTTADMDKEFTFPKLRNKPRRECEDNLDAIFIMNDIPIVTSSKVKKWDEKINYIKSIRDGTTLSNGFGGLDDFL